MSVFHFLFRCFVWMPFLGLVSAVAQTDSSASVAFTCAVSTPGTSFLEVDGQDLSPTGFVPGRTTGWIRLPAGKHSFKAEQQPGGSAEISLELAAGESKVLVLYTDLVAADKPGRPPRPELRLVAVPHEGKRAESQPRLLKLYSLLPSAVTLTTDQADLPEIAAEPKRLSLAGFKGKVGFVSLTEKTEPPVAEPLISINFQEPSTFFVFLYNGDEGKPKAISLEAP